MKDVRGKTESVTLIENATRIAVRKVSLDIYTDGILRPTARD